MELKVMAMSRDGIPMISTSNRWLLTGVAGFIGSNLLEELLYQNQTVIGIDNFSTGLKSNLDSVRTNVGEEKWSRFILHEMDIVESERVTEITSGCDYVLHQAALGSVPRSIKDPLNTHRSNVTGFLSVLDAARINKVKKFVFASSSSVYGDHPELPKKEQNIGTPLSPYAGTKLMDEIYADIFYKTYQMPFIGLRYFNVFGKRQSPSGEYAAVIPKWINASILGEDIVINGDGETSRDFCFIKNAVQANLLAAVAGPKADNNIYNIAFGQSNTLKGLQEAIAQSLAKRGFDGRKSKIIHSEFRPGDIRHSLADISKAERLLHYAPKYDLFSGIEEALEWYVGAATGPNGEGKGSIV